MELHEKLQLLRRQNGYSQEQLADKLGVSRQTVGKWETGQAIPELYRMVDLSDLYGVSIDRMVKDDQGCNLLLQRNEDIMLGKVIPFLLRAKKTTYAGHGAEITSSRPASHDLSYEEGDYLYYDTYLGGECFLGEEAVWFRGKPIWSMNYSGRVVGEHFQGDFLKEALFQVPYEMPYRGPAIYNKGDYSYHCMTDGEFIWFQGYEEIFYLDEKVYECYFHGGIVK